MSSLGCRSREHGVDDAGLTAGAVARRLGVAVTTLRTWHQRYGLGPSHHESGRHRRYTADDLACLDVMRRLTSQGTPAAEAARIAGATTRRTLEEPTPPTTSRAGGGRTIPLGRADPAARGLAAAAMRLDVTAMHRAIDAAVATKGVVTAWDTVLCPVLAGIGDRHARTNAVIEVEHLLTRCVSEVLSAVPRPTKAPSARILLACADEEQHSLPLEALAAALAERQVASRLLGARVPPASLRAAVQRTGPAMVMVWSHTAETADPAPLHDLVNHRPRPAVVAACGPGWTTTALPPEVAHPADLTTALTLATDLA